MTRAGASGAGLSRGGLRPLPTIRARKDFLAANHGLRIVTPAFILLVHKNGLGEARAGFTASRRIGGSVARHRARRRLKEMARLIAGEAVPGADHVFIARPTEVELPFAALLADGKRALGRARDRLGASHA